MEKHGDITESTPQPGKPTEKSAAEPGTEKRADELEDDQMTRAAGSVSDNGPPRDSAQGSHPFRKDGDGPILTPK